MDKKQSLFLGGRALSSSSSATTTSRHVDSFTEFLRKHHQQQDEASTTPFDVIHPGDAEYSEYMAAWLVTTCSIDNVVRYAVEVNLGKMRWTVHRRYSEFRDLRQTMLKHMGKRAGCSLCTATLRGMELLQFPPKTKPLYYISHKHHHAVDLSKRQAMLEQFVMALVGLIQMLRQHQLLIPHDGHHHRRRHHQPPVSAAKTPPTASAAAAATTPCDVTDLLRLIEEFFDLDFSRYTHFLAERGVLHHTESIVRQAAA
ncbi:Aste57867_765 [Aphanomyces stellatus]|uniref:Aste57867_765 protein n=1 Tax=Aphanomyces stellatus TaxID=120398 RepID=A0A485K3E7_9STRA|nr:hypothetical protein As57867_000764 [Aphanomyces stellatus]VFT77989.1 Aste57867_765 [Aphanomyces stellatus]